MLKPFRAIDKFIQRGKKGYSGYDLWSLDYYFYTIIPRMIRDFEKTLHGSPQLPFEEVDEFDYNWVLQNYEEILQSMKEFYDWFEEDEITPDNYPLDDHYIRFRLILRRIAYCFEEYDEENCSQKNEFQEEYFNQKYPEDQELFVPLEDNPKLYRMNSNQVDKELEENCNRREYEIEQYRLERKEEAFKLLNKYFECLWD